MVGSVILALKLKIVNTYAKLLDYVSPSVLPDTISSIGESGSLPNYILRHHAKKLKKLISLIQNCLGFSHLRLYRIRNSGMLQLKRSPLGYIPQGLWSYLENAKLLTDLTTISLTIRTTP